MKLSDQALGCVMMALQKSILTQNDITEILQRFEFVEVGENLLEITNPPTFEIPKEYLESEG